MIETLIKWDTDLFLFLNGIHSPFWDQFMWLVTGKYIWVPLYLFILGWLIRDYRWKAAILLVFIVLLITMSDQSSVKLFKQVFMRLRPCHEPAIADLVHIVNGKCGGKYGFVSSHAANTFAMAIFSLLLIQNRYYTFSIIFWASLVSYSRVYLGVHYPGDILCGAILGMIIGFIVYSGYRFTEAKILARYSKFR